MSRIRCLLLPLLLSFISAGSASALEITRYLAPDATGNGLSPETPTGDLQSVLETSARVDALTIYAKSGTYTLNLKGDPDHYPVFRNVIIACEDRDDKGHLKPMVIAGSSPRFENSVLYNISFKGGLGLNETNHLTHCHIDGGIGIMMRNSTDFINMNFVSASCINIYGNRGCTLRMHQCTIIGDNDRSGWGVEADKTTIKAYNCYFSDHKYGGVLINGGDKSTFNECQFMRNGGNGALTILCITDGIAAYMNNCRFEDNRTSTKDRSSAITALAPIAVRNTLFKSNSYNFDGKIDDNFKAAVSVISPKSYFEGCSFIDNIRALRYCVYRDAATPNYAQLENCLFYDNGVDIDSPYGAEPTMVNCAMEEGTGIPELDAQRGIIVVNEANVGLSDDGEIISPNSVLINAGIPYINKDVEGNPRQLLGGTDIGAFEYKGQWKMPSANAPKITYLRNEYVETSCTFNGRTFKALMPLHMVNDSDEYTSDIDYEWLYLGEQPLPMKIIKDGPVLHYMKIPDGKTIALLSATDENNEWYPIDAQTYSGTAPVAREVDGEWKLVAPSTQPAPKPAAKKPAASGSKPAARRSGPAVRPK